MRESIEQYLNKVKEKYDKLKTLLYKMSLYRFMISMCAMILLRKQSFKAAILPAMNTGYERYLTQQLRRFAIALDL